MHGQRFSGLLWAFPNLQISPNWIWCQPSATRHNQSLLIVMNMLKITLSCRRCPFARPLYAHNPDVLYFEHNLFLIQDVSLCIRRHQRGMQRHLTG